MSSIYLLVKVVIGFVAIAYLVAAIGLYVYQARFLFPGAFVPLPQGIETVAPSLGFAIGTIAAMDGTPLYVTHKAPEPRKPIVIVFHGNGSYPESYGFLYQGWSIAGTGVVAAAARGYPRSGGTADGERMLADALAIYDWTLATYPDHPIIVFGQSLGTSPAVHVAAKRDVAGVVLVSPFKSMLSLVESKFPYLPVSLMLKSPFRSDRDIAAIKAPILVFHGDRDTLVPISSARALMALTKTDVSFEMIAGAGHNEGLFDLQMTDRIDRFIETPVTKAL